MAEKIHDRYKVITYLTEEQLTELDEYRQSLGMSRSSAIGMMITTYLTQDKIITKSKNLDEMMEKLKDLTDIVKGMESSET